MDWRHGWQALKVRPHLHSVCRSAYAFAQASGEPVFRCAIDQRRGRRSYRCATCSKNRQYRVGAVIGIGVIRGIPRFAANVATLGEARFVLPEEENPRHLRTPSFIPATVLSPCQESQLFVIGTRRAKGHQVAEPPRFATFRFWLYRNAIPHAQR